MNFNGRSDPIAFISHFDVDHYDDRLFRSLGVFSPPTLDRMVAKRKSEFLAGRYCAKQCLHTLGIENFTVGTADKRYPIWPNGISGSLSHSNEIAIAAVSANPSIGGIGLDIERIIEADVIDDIKCQTVFDTELSLMEASGLDPGLVFTAIFSIKESFFKAVFPRTRTYFDFDAVRVQSLDAANGNFALSVQRSLAQTLMADSMFSGCFSFLDDHVLSMIVISEEKFFPARGTIETK